MVDISYGRLAFKDVPRAISLHLHCLKDGLLYSMGRNALTVFYEEALKDKNSFGFAALSERKVVGCVLATANKKNIYLRLLLRFSFLCNLIKNAKKALSVPVLFEGNLPDAELIFLYTHPAHRGKGIASQLVNLTEREFRRRKIKTYFLDVAVKNKNANSFYINYGFKLLKKVKKGEDSRNVYIKYSH